MKKKKSQTSRILRHDNRPSLLFLFQTLFTLDYFLSVRMKVDLPIKGHNMLIHSVSSSSLPPFIMIVVSISFDRRMKKSFG